MIGHLSDFQAPDIRNSRIPTVKIKVQIKKSSIYLIDGILNKSYRVSLLPLKALDLKVNIAMIPSYYVSNWIGVSFLFAIPGIYEQFSSNHISVIRNQALCFSKPKTSLFEIQILLLKIFKIFNSIEMNKLTIFFFLFAVCLAQSMLFERCASDQFLSLNFTKADTRRVSPRFRSNTALRTELSCVHTTHLTMWNARTLSMGLANVKQVGDVKQS